MAGRPKIFDEIEIIDKAIELFWVKGFEAASAEELLKAMNIGKGSFYLAFKGGKKELFEKSLIQFSDKSSKDFNVKIKNAQSPIDFLKEFFLSLPHLPLERKLQGCYLGNAVIEMAGIDLELKEKASVLLYRLEEDFKKIILEAQKKGTIKTKEPAKVIAMYLINLWNGIHVTQRLHPFDKNLNKMIELNLKILE